MGTRDKRIDAYITKSAPFAKPILNHLRAIVHKGCPQVVETMKWSFPTFEHHGLMCGMGSFKEHCTFGFWKASLMKDRKLLEMAQSEEAMGHLGRITSIKDLPADSVLLGYVREAAALNESGVKLPRRKATPESVKKALKAPPVLTKALARNAKAKRTFDAFSYSNKKDYIDWITEAKTEETRTRRLQTAVAWMAEGKVRNWKYLSKK